MYIYGLQTQCVATRERNSLDLGSACAEVVVQGFVAHLAIELVYVNKSTHDVEASYVCPVDATAAVHSFEAKVGGRVIKAHCLEKEKAKEAYKNAVTQGQVAFLGSMHEDAGDVFNLSLGNLPAGSTVELNLKMVMELPVNVDGSVAFKLPTIFNPRYAPADHESRLDESRSPVYPNQSKYSLDVKGEVRGSFKIAKVTSETDPINVQISDEDTTALITQDGGSPLDHDWSFQVFYRTVHQAHALQMGGDRLSTGLMKDDILMLNVFPEIPCEGFSPHNEIIFVVDRSGSMKGNKIVQAKSTLLLFLKSLPPGCRFNVISFGSTFSSLFDGSSERYTEQTLQKARQLQKSMDADMGGTEILEALKHVYSKDLIPGYPRQMIVLTDGQVWNQSHIFNLISSHADETRVFSVGLGDGASTALIQGMAKAGRGRCEMVLHDKQLQTKVMGLVASMLQEKARDVKVECEMDPPQTLLLVPKIPPVVFGGQHLILYARVTPKSEVKAIKIAWNIGDKEMKCEITDQDCKAVHDSNFSLHRLAAKAQLKQWEREDADRNQAALVTLSTSSNVVCSATSFIGIDQDGKTTKEEIPETECEDDLGGRGLYTDPMFCSGHFKKKSFFLAEKILFPKNKRIFARKRMCDSDSNSEEETGDGSKCTDDYLGPIDSISASDDETGDGSKCTDDDLGPIVSSQNFDGSWNLSDCCKFVNCPDDQLKKIQSQLSLDDDNCFATALTLALLQLKFASRKQEWHFLGVKGQMFLKSKNIEADKVVAAAVKRLETIAATV